MTFLTNHYTTFGGFVFFFAIVLFLCRIFIDNIDKSLKEEENSNIDKTQLTLDNLGKKTTKGMDMKTKRIKFTLDFQSL